MKKIILLASVLISSILVNAQTYVTLSDSVYEDRVLYNDTTYLLDGKVFVINGATLTIEEGTRIEGLYNSNTVLASALIVTRGSKINAVGTADEPIVFTAHIDTVTTSDTYNACANPGDWGGLVILGYAQTNQSDPFIEGIFEPFVPSGVDCNFGGTDDNDNSGTLAYVRVEYAGASIAADNELNAFTFGGVGCGTTLHHLEAYKGADDGFEFFGGTVSGKYLLSVSNNDDQFDFDFGFRGCFQFLVAILNTDVAYGSNTNGIECDNDGSGSSSTPLTRPVISNLTIAGPPSCALTCDGTLLNAVRFRRNSSFVVKNSIFYGFPTGIKVEGDSDGIFTHNVVYSCSTDLNFEADSLVTYNNNNLVTSVASIELNYPETYDYFFDTHEGLFPSADPALTGADFSVLTPLNCTFTFDSVVYKGGAVDADGDYWLTEAWVTGVNDDECDDCSDAVSSTTGNAKSGQTVTEEEEVAGADFTVYPNPATEKVTVILDEAATADASVSIVSLNDKVVMQKILAEGAVEVSFVLSGLEEGVYFVVYTNEGTQVSKKLIKK